VHYWTELQSVHRFHCNDNIHVCKLIALHTANAYTTEREMSASVCPRSMPGLACHLLLCFWRCYFCELASETQHDLMKDEVY